MIYSLFPGFYMLSFYDMIRNVKIIYFKLNPFLSFEFYFSSIACLKSLNSTMSLKQFLQYVFNKKLVLNNELKEF